MRKLILIAVLLFINDADLVAPLHHFMRLSVAMLVTLAYILVLVMFRPFKAQCTTTLGLAVATNVSLFCIYICISLLLVEHLHNGGQHADGISAVMVALTAVIALLTVAFVFQAVRKEIDAVKALRHKRTGKVARAPPLNEGSYHLFLSHHWGNQVRHTPWLVGQPQGSCACTTRPLPVPHAPPLSQSELCSALLQRTHLPPCELPRWHKFAHAYLPPMPVPGCGSAAQAPVAAPLAECADLSGC